jgi:hypothetical protein
MTKLIEAMVLTFMLAVPAHAGAECAWVLWVEGKETVEDITTAARWEVIQAAQSEKICETALQAKMNLEKRDDVVSSNAVRFRRGRSLMTFRYLCLPDTVDPRGPKGGGR